MTVLFISDLHLTPERPGIARAFCEFMTHRAPSADALYILGDFFEYWVGDDAMEPFHHEMAAQLKAFTDTGKPLHLMPGNRDFAIGKQFLKATRAQWLQDPTLIDLNGERVLLMHGDLLCTQDVQYLKYRKRIRHPLVLSILRMTPLSYRKKLGQKIRENSKRAKTGKSLNIMDVTPEEVVRMMEQSDVKTLIHGHTHRPAIHQVSLQQGEGRRYVLGDWDRSGWCLEASEKGLDLQEFSI
ncbi:UDP-2,3-diacylglucosamine diphosphatase [Endozoicomonas sp. (ex Bugula neritina AB1)]|nr:UDP-2,3-diacylglucosamine diphosphatase [Endozoicomonas sp. (ex Bugula neritina AB1)]